jgi:maltose alpha-D-glucosyltransferase/alpha-amylase
MLRSFHYASYAGLLGQTPAVRPEDFATLEPWARFWYLAVSAAFLKGYLEVVGPTTLLPRIPDELWTLLDAYLLEKAIYEVSYELTYRPTWVRIPLTGILDLLASRQALVP